MAPPTTSNSATTAGKTWAEIEAGPDPWGHPLDYRTMKRVMGLNSPFLGVLDRFDVSKPHGNVFGPEELQHAEGFVSTDVGAVIVSPTELAPGQYYKSTEKGAVVRRFTNANDAPANVGGFHGFVIDTQQPGTHWLLLTRFIDVGPVFAGGPEMGIRPHVAMLVRPDVLLNDKPNAEGLHNERRALAKVCDIALPSTSGKVLFTCPAQDWSTDGSGGEHGGGSVMACVGDGYYPVMVGRDRDGKVCKITVLFMGELQDYHHGTIPTSNTATIA